MTTELPAPRRDLVVMGASAGGVETLKRVIGGLPADLPAAVCVVLHISASAPSSLAGILDRSGRLTCSPARDGDELSPGRILVAPPDHHLLVEGGHVRLSLGPRENGHRPSVDALFRSAAEAAGERVVGVILSGSRDDGTAGLAVVKDRGGAALVQDPAEALFSGMPASAATHVAADAILRSHDIAAAITAFVTGTAGRGAGVSAVAPLPGDELITVCPECGGVLSERQESGVPRWECHVGHIYSPGSLAADQGATAEAALWTAVRTLKDRGALLRRMADQAQARAQDRSAGAFRAQAEQAYRHADAIRMLLGEAVETVTLELAEAEADAAMDTGDAA